MRLPFPALRLLALLAVPLAGGAQASALRWEPAAGGAAIVLPVPERAQGIKGASLFCRAQEWALLLRADRAMPAGETAKIEIGEEIFPLAASGPLTLPVPRAMLAALKDGAAMTVTVGEGGDALEARFPLAGSRAAIQAVAPLCSAPEVAGFEAVALAPAGEAAEAAKLLTAEESALFREATMREPALAAGFVPAEAGRKLLFASLCGSNRYYGETGCKLMGFAADEAGGWRSVYETEGMHLFRDPRLARGGWPDLLTLPIGADAAERLRWAWTGDAYQAQDDAAIAAGPPEVVDELRTGTTE